jgi:hypothetical protein
VQFRVALCDDRAACDAYMGHNWTILRIRPLNGGTPEPFPLKPLKQRSASPSSTLLPTLLLLYPPPYPPPPYPPSSSGLSLKPRPSLAHHRWTGATEDEFAAPLLQLVEGVRTAMASSARRLEEVARIYPLYLEGRLWQVPPPRFLHVWLTFHFVPPSSNFPYCDVSTLIATAGCDRSC